MSHKVWRSSNRCYETSHQPQNLSQFVWTTVSGCLVQVTEQWAHCVCQRNDRRCRVIRGNYPVARGAVVDVNEAGKVCLLANGRTTEMHVGLDTPTHWCILPSTNSLIDIYFVNTKDLKKGLAGRTFKSKSKSIAFKSKSLEPKSESKSKSSKNGLKSGLESKSGLEYYKSDLFCVVFSVMSCSHFYGACRVYTVM